MNTFWGLSAFFLLGLVINLAYNEQPACNKDATTWPASSKPD